MESGDLPALEALLPHLGYHVTLAELTARYERARNSPEHAFLVTEGAGVTGWAHVFGVRLLESAGYAELGGIVVAPEHRRQGIGKGLVAACAQWARSRGFQRLRLSSGVHRDEAHRFYEAFGFHKAKAAYAFEMTLA